jgi:hypothetical protein
VNRLVRLARTAASSGLSSDAVAAAYLHDALQLSAATPAMLEEAGLTFRTRQLVMLGTPKLMGQPLADPEACALWLLNQAERFDALHANIVTLGRRFALGVWIKAPIEAEPFIRVCRFPVAAQTWLDRFEALGRVIRPRDTPPLV